MWQANLCRKELRVLFLHFWWCNFLTGRSHRCVWEKDMILHACLPVLCLILVNVSQVVAAVKLLGFQVKHVNRQRTCVFRLSRSKIHVDNSVSTEKRNRPTFLCSSLWCLHYWKESKEFRGELPSNTMYCLHRKLTRYEMLNISGSFY